jgi:SAM-dependent methyltransferase
MKKILNVGGNSKQIPLPDIYAGWEHVLLDIDERGMPDVVCDARQLSTLPASTYDSVYCSHNLEHYYRHDALKVLAGFVHVLKNDGFLFVRVPDLDAVMRTVVEKKLDIDDILYQSPSGPIAVRDVIYGCGLEIERSGNDFFAHKTGFTQKSLTAILLTAGFQLVFAGCGSLEVAAYAFLNEPTAEVKVLLNFPQRDQ